MKKTARKRTTRIRTVRKPRKAALFLHKPGCASCRKARNFLQKRGFQLTFRDLWKQPLSAAELEKLIGKGDHTDFLNERSELYRQNNMEEEPPSRREAIRLMAQNPELLRRPVVVAGGRVVLGFDEKGMLKL